MHTPSPGTRALAPSTPAISASFTPGPWREHSHRQIGPDAGIVCEVWSASGSGDAAIKEADANVDLIAAAPDLHQACTSAERLLTRQKFRATEHTDEGRTLLALRAALAKVEGGAS